MDSVQTIYKLDEYDLNEVILWLNFEMVANQISVDDARDMDRHSRDELFGNAVWLYEVLGDFDSIPRAAHMSTGWEQDSLLVINSADATALMAIFSGCYITRPTLISASTEC